MHQNAGAQPPQNPSTALRSMAPKAPSSAAATSAEPPSPDAAATPSSPPGPRPIKPPTRQRYLAVRRGRFVFVRRFPRRLVEAGVVKRASFRKSLGTSNWHDAERIARRLAVQFDDLMSYIEAYLWPKPAPARSVDMAAARLRHEAMVRLAGHIDELLSQPGDGAPLLSLPTKSGGTTGNLGQPAVHMPSFAVAEVLGVVDATPSASVEVDACKPALLFGATAAGEAVGDLLPPPTTRAGASDGVVQHSASAARAAQPHPVPPGADDLDDLTRAYEHWVAKAGPGRKTLLEVRPVWQRLQTFTGKQRVSALTRDDVLAFQASELQRKRGDVLVRPQTANKLIALVSAIVRLAHDDLLCSRGIANPFDRLRKAKVRGTDVIDKQDLTLEELASLFSGRVHREGHRPIGGGGEAAYWMPLLGYATGARMGELAQLQLAEVLERDGIWCLWLTNREADDGNTAQGATERAKLLERSLKTGQSRRIVPLHPSVLELGFLDYVQWLKKQKEVRLFPSIRPDSKGNVAGRFSKWFNLYLGHVGIKRRGLDWISFRHTLKTACRAVKMDADIQDYLEGHQAQRASQNYGKFNTALLFDAVKGIALPGLAAVPRWQVPTSHKVGGRA